MPIFESWSTNANQCIYIYIYIPVWTPLIKTFILGVISPVSIILLLLYITICSTQNKYYLEIFSAFNKNQSYIQ